MNPPARAARETGDGVCFFGTYARNHTANLLLRQDFEAMGCGVEELHAPLWEETRDKAPQYFQAGSLARLGGRYAARALRLAPQVLRRRPRLWVGGFNGQLDVILLRLLRWRAPLVFAPLVSITETIVEDRRVHAPQSAVARLVALLDRLSLSLPTRVLIDTEAHRRYLLDRFGLAPERVARWHLGADTSVFRRSAPQPRRGPLRVLFYGQFLPLHGVDTILAAMAALSSDADFELTVVGTGPERRRALAALSRRAAERIRLIEWVPYPQLGQLIAGADVCLGTFGASAKAAMVIPNKVYQAAAVGRAVVTADSPALREVFTPGENIAICPPADAEALAEVVRGLRHDDERDRLAAGAAALMAERFSPPARVQALRAALGELAASVGGCGRG